MDKKEILSLQDDFKIIFNELEKNFLTQNKPENRHDRDFFNYVKKETDPLFEKLNQWYNQSIQVVENKKEGKVYPTQIEKTKENIELLILHSYYIDVPKKRYKELKNSIEYVFQQLRQILI